MKNPVHYAGSHGPDEDHVTAVQALCELHILQFLKEGRTVKLLDTDISEQCSVCCPVPISGRY